MSTHIYQQATHHFVHKHDVGAGAGEDAVDLAVLPAELAQPSDELVPMCIRTHGSASVGVGHTIYGSNERTNERSIDRSIDRVEPSFDTQTHDARTEVSGVFS